MTLELFLYFFKFLNKNFNIPKSWYGRESESNNITLRLAILDLQT